MRDCALNGDLLTDDDAIWIPTTPNLDQATFDLDGPIDQLRLRTACQLLLDAHESLRTCFPEPGKRVVMPDVAVPWRTTYLTTSDERTRRTELDTVLADDRTRGFDPTRPPLLRVHLLRFRPQRHTLVLSMHGAVAESLPELFAEIFQLYAGEVVSVADGSNRRDHSRPRRDQ